MTKINWDKEKIEDLEKILMGLSDEDIENTAWDSLPSYEIPEDVDTTEVWAMDSRGNCLCGLIHDIVEGNGNIRHIDEIRSK